MINFVNGSAANTLRYHGDDSAYAGMLRTPESGNRVENAVELGMSWVLDNGCFSKYDPPAILRMLHRFRGVGGCKFATVPDVVGDHAATILLFRAWVGTYRALGYPPAFVLQDGVSIHTVPWDSIDAVFVGGSTAFKYSDQIREIVTEANRRNKWVHMGRVNSAARMGRKRGALLQHISVCQLKRCLRLSIGSRTMRRQRAAWRCVVRVCSTICSSRRRRAGRGRHNGRMGADHHCW